MKKNLIILITIILSLQNVHAEENLVQQKSQAALEQEMRQQELEQAKKELEEAQESERQWLAQLEAAEQEGLKAAELRKQKHGEAALVPYEQDENGVGEMSEDQAIAVKNKKRRKEIAANIKAARARAQEAMEKYKRDAAAAEEARELRYEEKLKDRSQQLELERSKSDDRLYDLGRRETRSYDPYRSDYNRYNDSYASDYGSDDSMDRMYMPTSRYY